MKVFIQQLINGLSLGSIYALIALGYTMVYGIVQLINFAHGDIYMVGAYVAFFATAVMGWGFLPAMLLAMATCAIMGVVIEYLAYRPLRNAPRVAPLITAIGVSFFLEYGMMVCVGPQVRTFPKVLSDVQFHIAGIDLNNRQVIIFVVTVLLMLILQYIVHKTRIGKAMRAVAHDKQAAQLMGINVNTTISATFAIGSGLAAAAGVLVGIYYNAINPLMGIMPGLKAFCAAVLGGIGIIPGAMTGGILLGVVEAMVSGYGDSLFRDPVAFVILIIILIVKPTGLFGRNVREKV